MFNHRAESPQVFMEEANAAREYAQREYSTARRLEDDARHFLHQAELCDNTAGRLIELTYAHGLNYDPDAKCEYASARQLRKLAAQDFALAQQHRGYARAANERAERYESLARDYFGGAT